MFFGSAFFFVDILFISSVVWLSELINVYLPSCLNRVKEKGRADTWRILTNILDVPAAVTKVMGKTLVLNIFSVSSAIYLLQNR